MFLFNSILLFVVIFLVIVLSMIWPPDSPWAPWWNVKKKTARAMCQLADVKKNDVVYDLGSGDGTSLIVAAREYDATCVGIEIDPLRAFLSQIAVRRAGVTNQVTIYRENFFDHDISDATVIFVYLVPKALQRLLPKLKKELKPGTRIVSYRYSIDLLQKKHDRQNELRLYIL